LAPLILLVDDFKDALEMYSEYLTFKGYRIRIASTGERAIEVAQAETPAIISDSQKPNA
jgi:CheY-like chemotaxis protein